MIALMHRTQKQSTGFLHQSSFGVQSCVVHIRINVGKSSQFGKNGFESFEFFQKFTVFLDELGQNNFDNSGV